MALVLIDVINDLEFPGGRTLLRHALPMAHRIARLKARCKDVDIPVIYVNDNFGKWRSEFSTLVRRCLQEPVRGQPLVRVVAPGRGDYAVVKPKHSGFYATPLELLLAHLGARTLILAGLAGDACVLLTAADAYLRGHPCSSPEIAWPPSIVETTDGRSRTCGECSTRTSRPRTGWICDAW